MPHDLGYRVAMQKRLEQQMLPEHTREHLPKQALNRSIPKRHQQPKEPKGY